MTWPASWTPTSTKKAGSFSSPTAHTAAAGKAGIRTPSPSTSPAGPSNASAADAGRPGISWSWPGIFITSWILAIPPARRCIGSCPSARSPSGKARLHISSPAALAGQLWSDTVSPPVGTGQTSWSSRFTTRTTFWLMSNTATRDSTAKATRSGVKKTQSRSSSAWHSAKTLPAWSLPKARLTA